MTKSHHPLFLGPSATPLRGVWVRHKVTGYAGYINHVERSRNPEGRPLLWIVYPPGHLDDGITRVKTWSAGSAYADEVKKLNRPKKELSA